MGDSTENNRTFKSEWYCTKDDLLLWKYEQGLTRVIKHEDIMPILNHVFPKAFGHKRINKHAMAERDYNAFNHKLVEHPSFVDGEHANCQGPPSDGPLSPLHFENAEGMGTSV